MRFSIIVVCLNPGEKLKQTIYSILGQSNQDYEIIVKDGGSVDGSLQDLPTHDRIHMVCEKDQGIYDAMNQAMDRAVGEYLYFLNCGDVFHDQEVLQTLEEELQGWETKKLPDILYGNIYDKITESQVFSNPALDAFGCYRNVPCHQACFYRRELLLQHPFALHYRVRADYEQFLWCFFVGKARLHYLPIMIADYEGGGFSENRENLKRSAKEHKLITRQYMTWQQRFTYGMMMVLTLAPFRTYLSHHPVFGKMYNALKRKVLSKKVEERRRK